MNLRESKLVAWTAMLLIVVAVVFTICMRYVESIWDYVSIFCAFMMVFSHLMALSLKKMSASASRKLDIASLIFGILTVLSIILIFIFYQVSL